VRTLDIRSRTSGDIRTVDVADFFGHELPALFEARGTWARAAAAAFDASSFSFVTPSGAYTLVFDGDGFAVEAGDTGTASAVISDDDVAAIVNDLKTPMTLLTGGTLEMRRRGLNDFLDWWVLLRSLLDERAAYTAGSVSFIDRDGSSLDLSRSFTPDDEDDDIGHFLTEAGFVHLRDWLDPADMTRISADMDDALPSYTPDDGRSWWARTAGGEHRCVRMQGFDAHSPTTARLLDGEAIARIAALTGDGHSISRFGGSRVEALEKPIGVVEGISDVPWHKDCSLGMHSYNCSNLTIGISVTGADATSGQLRVVAGSHRALMQPAFVRPGLDLPIVDLPTATGDVTVHCSCTLHMAQPPVDRERRVLYTGVKLPPLEPADAYRDGMSEIGRVREGAYKTVSQTPARPNA
jgi:hypothetical protein